MAYNLNNNKAKFKYNVDPIMQYILIDLKKYSIWAKELSHVHLLG